MIFTAHLVEATRLAALIGLTTLGHALTGWLLLLVNLRHEPLVYGDIFGVQAGVMRRLIFLYLAE